MSPLRASLPSNASDEMAPYAPDLPDISVI